MHLHDRAGTLASLLYKAEKPSVCTFLHADISIASAWIETGLVYYIKLKSRLSVRPSVCLSDRHAGISAVSAWIEAGLARNGS